MQLGSAGYVSELNNTLSRNRNRRKVALFEITDVSGKINCGLAVFKRTAVMLFPDDERVRTQCVAALLHLIF
jgi:hypothetical protein